METTNRRLHILVAIFLTVGILGNFIGAVDGLKPEIQHKFREPEKRPPIVVTTFFTLLVASPALILLTFWTKSVSLNFETLSIRRLVFHALFLAILICYTRFWLGSNMFDTMTYVAPLMFLLFNVFK